MSNTQQTFELAKRTIEGISKMKGVAVQDVMKAMAKIQQDKVADPYKGVEMVTLGQLEAKAKGQRVFDGIATGVKSLDDVLLGFKPGDLVCVAGVSNIGKSSMTLLWGKNMSRAGVKSLYLFFEDGEEEVGGRGKLLNSGMKFKESELNNIYVYPLPALAPFYKDPTQVIAAIRVVANVLDVKVVFIDMINDLVKVNTADQADELVRDLKLLAEELKITIVFTAKLRKPNMLSQQSRDSEKFHPSGESIAGFNSLEFLATKIITISEVPRDFMPAHKSAGFNDPDRKPFAVHVAKNRTGKKTIDLPGGLVCEWAQYPNAMVLSDLGYQEYEC